MFWFACSVVLWGGRGTADKYHWPVWGALTVFRPHWVCPRLWCVCLPRLHCSGSRLLYRESVACSYSFQVLHKSSYSVGPAFGAFPSPSSSGSQELDERTLPGAVCLIPSSVPASVSARTGLVSLVSVLGSWPLAATLPVDVNHPESQEVFC